LGGIVKPKFGIGIISKIRPYSIKIEKKFKKFKRKILMAIY